MSSTKERTWTPEQEAIFLAARETKDNLLIEALAGAAKTSTLVELSRHLGSGGTLAIAFNKKIADEMQERMPKGVECRTLNSLGHRAWQQKLGRKMILSDSKIHTLTLEAIEELPSGEEKDHLYETLSDSLNAIRGAKNHGHVPSHYIREMGDRVSPLLDDETLFDMLPEEYSDAQHDLILQVLRRSFAEALEGRTDFADQLLMPTVCRCIFPSFANVLVDEAQDLSELNHRMLEKFAKRRLIAVGDSCQAIYAFRGAHREGMPLLAQRFNMTTLHLSTTFRCPEAICDHVRWHVPRIEPWTGNPNNPGTITRLQAWTVSDIPDKSVVICRNNAPLFRLAIKMLRAGKRPNVWGRDIAAGLIKILESLAPANAKREAALTSLARYRAEKLAKLRKASAKQALEDRVDCLRVFIEDAETLGGAVALAKHVFNEGGVIDLCSGHKSKGSEWNDVFILDEWLLGDDGQEHNLRYVMATRAKRSLTYINFEGLATH